MKITYNTSDEELKQLMSESGNPDKFIKIMHELHVILYHKIDHKNLGEVVNADIILRRLRAEAALWLKITSRNS